MVLQHNLNLGDMRRRRRLEAALGACGTGSAANILGPLHLARREAKALGLDGLDHLVAALERRNNNTAIAAD